MTKKYFSSFLQEALSPEQQVKVDQWVAMYKTPSGRLPAQELTSASTFNGEHTIIHPLYTDSLSHDAIHPAIHEHLQKHGYHIPTGDEYRNGYCLDSHNRQTKIGGVLNKTGAGDDLKDAFEHDPIRSGGTSGLSVAYTWHPHHVAGMSTDRGWTSCMDLNDGQSIHHLEDDISQGTHVAYLIHSHDHEIKNPIARIAMKPFHSIDGHTVLVPESKMYGTGSTAFGKAVDSWTDTHFPMKKNMHYRIHGGVYADTHTGYSDHDDAIIKKHMHKAVNGDLSSYHFISNDLKSPKNIHSAINHVLDMKPEELKSPDNSVSDKTYAVAKILSGKDAYIHPDTLSLVVGGMKDGKIKHDGGSVLHTLLHEHGTRLNPSDARKAFDMAVDSKTPIHSSTTGSILNNVGVVGSDLMRGVNAGSVDIHDIPSRKYTPELIDHIHQHHSTYPNEALAGSNSLRSKHMTEPLIHDVMHKLISGDQSWYNTVRAANNLSEGKTKAYTIDLARDLDKTAHRWTDEEKHYGISLIHKDATPEDLETHADLNSNKITGKTWRDIRSPAVIDHAMESRHHQTDYLSALYQHNINPRSKHSATTQSVVGIPKGYPAIAKMVSDAKPGMLFDGHLRSKSEQNIAAGTLMLSEHPEHHHAIRTALNTSIKYGDNDLASKILSHTLGRVTFPKTHVDTIASASGKDFSHIPTSD